MTHWLSYIISLIRWTALFFWEIRFPDQFRMRYEKMLITYSWKHIIGEGNRLDGATEYVPLNFCCDNPGPNKQTEIQKNRFVLSDAPLWRTRSPLAQRCIHRNPRREIPSRYTLSPRLGHRACARSCCSLWRTHVCNYSARLPKCFLKRAFQDGGTTQYPMTCLPAQLLFRGTFVDVIFAESHYDNNAIVRMAGAGKCLCAFSENVNRSHVTLR